jgi:hypothetical protein
LVIESWSQDPTVLSAQKWSRSFSNTAFQIFGVLFGHPAIAGVWRVLSGDSSRRNIELITGDLLSRDDCRRAPKAFQSFIISLPEWKSVSGCIHELGARYSERDGCVSTICKPKRFVNVAVRLLFIQPDLKRGALLMKAAD